MSIDQAQLAEKVGYLLDRAAISDLLFAFARALDSKDWKGYENLMTEDVIIEIPVKRPDGSFVRIEGRDGIAERVGGSEKHPGLNRFVATHHLSSNHQITIDGDTAATHSYAQCVHRLNDDPGDVWELGGWYICQMRRISSREWKFSKVHLDMVWEHGNPRRHA